MTLKDAIETLNRQKTKKKMKQNKTKKKRIEEDEE